MPNGVKPGLLSAGLELAQRVGPVGGAGMGLCYTAAKILLAVGDKPNRLEHASDAFIGMGFAIFSYSLGKGLKRNTDMQAVVAAESKIDRAKIAPGVVHPASADPVVDKVIGQQVRRSRDEGVRLPPTS